MTRSEHLPSRNGKVFVMRSQYLLWSEPVVIDSTAAKTSTGGSATGPEPIAHILEVALSAEVAARFDPLGVELEVYDRMLPLGSIECHRRVVGDQHRCPREIVVQVWV